jgi:diadenosine tetraphosphate (Ap4A) HIT family hydrolase
MEEGNLSACPFCSLPPARIWLQTASTIAFRDGFPVSDGHTLVIPRRHVASLFELPEDEQREVWSQISIVRRRLEEEFNPDGFNIGLNDGEAAGQTVAHTHVHIIPRYRGDVPDPRGGVRWIIPQKAAYWPK